SPTFVENDPGVPASQGDSSDESPTIASSTFSSQYTHWSTPFRVLVYRATDTTTDPLSLNPLNYYETIGDGRIVQVSVATGTAPPDPTKLPDVGPQIDPVSGVFKNTNPAF